MRATAKNVKNRYTDAKEMHDDLKTALTDARATEPRYTFKYAEEEGENKRRPVEPTKKVEVKEIKETKEEVVVPEKKKKEEKKSAKIEEKEMKKKENKILLILSIIFVGLVVIVTTLVFLIPKFTEVKEVKIPDTIINMSVVDAERELEKMGLTVASETKDIASSDIVSGNVVRTSPSIGRTVKKGTEITLYVSTGENGYIVEDLKGKNVDEVKAVLEKMYNLLVIIKKEEAGVDAVANTIVKSEPEAGARLTEGQQIILYVPDMTTVYPDFTKGKYTLKEIEALC